MHHDCCMHAKTALYTRYSTRRCSSHCHSGRRTHLFPRYQRKLVDNGIRVACMVSRGAAAARAACVCMLCGLRNLHWQQAASPLSTLQHMLLQAMLLGLLVPACTTEIYVTVPDMVKVPSPQPLQPSAAKSNATHNTTDTE